MKRSIKLPTLHECPEGNHFVTMQRKPTGNANTFLALLGMTILGRGDCWQGLTLFARSCETRRLYVDGFPGMITEASSPRNDYFNLLLLTWQRKRHITVPALCSQLAASARNDDILFAIYFISGRRGKTGSW